MKSTRFIKYSEPNQEPKEHLEGKFRIHHLLGRQGYCLLSNTDKWEFQLEPIKTELDGTKNYTLDVLMYNTITKRIVGVEINGAYHFANKTRIGKTVQKLDEVKEYFFKRNHVEVNGVPFHYTKYKIISFTTEELIGKHCLDDDYVTGVLLY